MKIFLADDDRIIRLGLRKILTRANPDYEIIGEAANGEDALNQIKECEPDLLITDVKMPIMDGIELIGELRAQEIPLKIIVLSGFGEYDFVRKTLKNGATDYLLKPVDRSELLDLVEVIHQQTQQKMEKEEDATYCLQVDSLQPVSDTGGIIGVCKKYIEIHYAEKITLNSMAEYSGLSECYFSSLFKSKTGKNFYDYLSSVRIQKAQELLIARPQDKIYEIGSK
ncbi:MAG: response regulator, partial [Ruthenibacterium sp.]